MSAFVTKNPLITQMRETIKEWKTRLCLMPGYAYLAKNEIEKSYEVFVDLVLGGLDGLCVTRKFPPRVRHMYCLKKTSIVWLTEEKVEGESTVYSLQDLSILINQFLERTEHGVVLLDGLEYLVVNHGFEHLIRFLQLIRGRFEQTGGILIVPVLEEALELERARLIEREMKILKL